jgi:hypothetical protein
MLEGGRRSAIETIWSLDNQQTIAEARAAGVTPYTNREMNDRLLDAWGEQHYPYALGSITHIAASEHYPAFVIGRAGSVTYSRLADFSRHRGYDGHELHGTLGKTFDVLAVASGLKKVQEVGASHVEEKFITYTELKRYLQDHALSRHYRRRIYSEFTLAITEAVWRARPRPYGELVFEGSMSLAGPEGYKFERIALSSLLSLAAKFRKASPAAEALLGLRSDL